VGMAAWGRAGHGQACARVHTCICTLAWPSFHKQVGLLDAGFDQIGPRLCNKCLRDHPFTRRWACSSLGTTRQAPICTTPALRATTTNTRLCPSAPELRQVSWSWMTMGWEEKVHGDGRSCVNSIAVHAMDVS